jgi:glycine/D-amino acid oxidase-like deaminating enzyme
MRPEILIVGQGLAGTLLAWELERAGLAFEIADAGHAGTASAAAAGMISPITGRRLVPSWRYETLRPIARDAYRAIEAALGVPLWREMRVRRLFADTREQEIFSERHARGEFAPWLVGHDDAGFSVNGAAHVDVERLLTASRTRWRAAGWLREEVVDVMAEVRRRRCVIDCTGLVAARAAPWAFFRGSFPRAKSLPWPSRDSHRN